MSDLVLLPGVERRDLVGQAVPSEEVLRHAIANDVTDVVVVGRGRDGHLYVASETNDVDRVAGILVRAANHIASGFYGDNRLEHVRPSGER